MEHKSTVVKSKSSNSAILPKIDKNKKTSSNYDIKTNLRNKRGVYSEKSQKQEPVPIKPPKRPRPGKKKFLASVLTILSKSTAGTQYPEKDNSDRVKERFKPRSAQKTDPDKKSKYKSRVLREQKEDDIIVLKSMRDISQTPSTSSKTDNYKWSYTQKDRSSQNSLKYALDNNLHSLVSEGPAKDLLGRNKKRLRIQEPAKTTEAEKTVDKKIYNFFVDLLESTFDMCDDCDANESKMKLEVDESIVKKLVIKDNSPIDEKKNYKSDIDKEKHQFLNSFYENTLNINVPDVKVRPRQRIINSKKEKPVLMNIIDAPKKIRKPKKELLDILKEELRKDASTYEEPQNIYEALRVMAKNKKKTENSLRFNKKHFIERFNNDECMLRRNVLFKSKKKNRKPDQKTKYGSRSFEVKHDRFPSHHSLQVYGYDFEEPVKFGKSNPRKLLPVPIPSSSSIEDSDVYCSTLDFPVASSARYSQINRFVSKIIHINNSFRFLR